jgi:hypothetical protein
MALTVQKISKSESRTLHKPEITAETDDDTFIMDTRTIFDGCICYLNKIKHLFLPHGTIYVDVTCSDFKNVQANSK